MKNVLLLASWLAVAAFVAARTGVPGSAAKAAQADKTAPEKPASADLAQNVQAIFRTHCANCHGPKKQRGDFRLDTKEAALKGAESGPVILPGKAADSPLLRRVASSDKNERMPPMGEPLDSAQVGLLRTWIDQGAPWPESVAQEDSRKAHWSFKPVARPNAPAVANARWARNALDRFILARLEKEALAPSPEADRRTLIRRLSFDLLGLPPTPEEVEVFLADRATDAYEKLVERLLASPHYGERWARHWLDVVRFAESNGFEMNQPRANAWPYRDYVIRAFNENKPFDRFVQEQLAGDALGVDEATGFLVAGPWDQVKSPDPVLTAQQRSDELHDMVSTTGSAFLGLTVGCARCHDHKFDPIAQSDYYAVTADLAGVQHGERAVRPADFDQRQKQAAELRCSLAALDAELEPFLPRARLARVLLLDGGRPPSARPTERGINELIPARSPPATYEPGAGRGELDDRGDLLRLPTLGRSYRTWVAADGADVFSWNPAVSGRYRVWVSWGAGFATHAPDAHYVLDRDGDLQTRDDQTEIAVVDQRKFADGTGDVPGRKLWSGFYDAGVHELGPASRVLLRGGQKPGVLTADALLLEEVRPDEDVKASRRVPRVRPPVSHRANEDRFEPSPARFVRFTVLESSGSEPCLDELEVFTTGADSRNVALAAAGAKVRVSGTLPGFAIHKLEHLIDGRYGNDFSWISSEPGKGWVLVELAEARTIDRVVWSRDRSGGAGALEDRLATGYRIEISLDGKQWQVVADSADRLPPQLRKQVPAISTLPAVPDGELARVRLLAARRSAIEKELSERITLPMVYAGRFEQPKATHRLYRGDPMQPREETRPAALASFGKPLELKTTTPEQERRLALARWITDPQNPLTPRVLVNRLWQYHFGEGIVSTPSDFGINGARPTHPELLDWLASECVAQKWDLKEMHRLIVRSSTYRQSSQSNPRGLAVDAGSRLLWRFPPRRLEAEPLRDSILAVCGNLDPKVGGPGFDLFEPNTNYVKVYAPKTKFGPAEWRRMIYQTKPRMQLDDVFGAFDCPDGGQITPKRTRSTTPLQALNLLNSPFTVQQAEIFAERLRREAGSDARAEVKRAFLLAFSRDPAEDELAGAARLIQTEGLTVFCRALVNANEFAHVP